jgi:hypothetical protein
MIVKHLSTLPVPRRQRELERLLNTPSSDRMQLKKNALLMTELRELGVWPPRLNTGRTPQEI